MYNRKSAHTSRTKSTGNKTQNNDNRLEVSHSVTCLTVGRQIRFEQMTQQTHKKTVTKRHGLMTIAWEFLTVYMYNRETGYTLKTKDTADNIKDSAYM